VVTSVEFPFERGRLHSLGELRAFERRVLIERQRDPKLSKALRDPRGTAPAWMRLRNKELVPLKVFADQVGFPDEDHFVLMPAGDPVDARIVGQRETLDLQLTLAAPIWGSEKGPQQNSGYQHHQIVVALNENAVVVGYPPYAGTAGVAEGRIDAISNEDRDRACLKGLSTAVAKKAPYDGGGCALAIFAQEFYMHLLEVPPLELLVDAVLKEHPLRFDSVSVFDSHPGFFVRRPLGKR
jgi:hypothetical protein